MLVVDKDGTDYLADVGDLTAGTDNNSTRRDDLLAIGILLTQREGVLTCRHVDVQVTAEITQCLDGCIQTGILSFL